MTTATAEITGINLVRPARVITGYDSHPVAGIAKCKRCKSAKRVDGNIRRVHAGYGRYEARIEWPTVVCSCGNQYPMIDRIKGRTTEHVCDSRCTHAKGPNCDCSCGGKNHGSGL